MNYRWWVSKAGFEALSCMFGGCWTYGIVDDQRFAAGLCNLSWQVASLF
jgi:hypothetical protein